MTRTGRSSATASVGTSLPGPVFFVACNWLLTDVMELPRKSLTTLDTEKHDIPVAIALECTGKLLGRDVGHGHAASVVVHGQDLRP